MVVCWCFGEAIHLWCSQKQTVSQLRKLGKLVPGQGLITQKDSVNHLPFGSSSNAERRRLRESTQVVREKETKKGIIN